MDINALRCPNDPPCGHPGAVHDIAEPGDPYPTCCIGSCRCGHPGDAVCQRRDDGTVVVLRADPVIRVSRELLNEAEPWVYDSETQILQLDTAGEYRYAYLRPDPKDSRCVIFGALRLR